MGNYTGKKKKIKTKEIKDMRERDSKDKEIKKMQPESYRDSQRGKTKPEVKERMNHDILKAEIL